MTETPRKEDRDEEREAREERARSEGVHPLARPFLWLDKPFARDVISLIIVLGAMILLAVDFFVNRYGETAIAERPGFYAIFGFISFALAVLAGWPLRRLLERPSDYYDEPEDSDA